MIIDCTHQLSTDLPGYPGDPATLEIHQRISDHNSLGSTLHLSTHFGTHIDSPQHFYPEKPGMDSRDVTTLSGKAIWLFCEPATRGYTLAPSIDLWSLPKTDWIFFFTGWSTRWGSDAYYQEFPGIEPAIIEDLTDLDIRGIGLDAPSIDPIPDDSYQNHLLWLGSDRFLLENLRWSERIQDMEIYQTYVAPLPIPALEAAPCLVFHETP